MFPPVLVLAVLAAVVGWFSEDLYQKDSAFMAIKSQALDLVHLALIIPLGLLMFVLARQGRLGQGYLF